MCASNQHQTKTKSGKRTPKRNAGVSDVFAFVSIELGAVIFRRGDELTSATTYISPEEFMDENQSMQKTFDSFK